MSNPSDDTKPSQARVARSRRRRILPVVVLLLAVAGIGGVVLWEKYGRSVAPSQTAEADTSGATPAATETSEPLDPTAQLLKDLQTAQQQMADKLEDVQRQLAAEQEERKAISDQVAALSSRINGMSASNAFATTGAAAQAAKKKPKSPDASPLRPAGANRQAGPAQ
jgi:uncharacterized protein HemX